MPVAAVPESVAVPLPLSRKRNPEGKVPVKVRAGGGKPEVVTLKVAELPTLKVVVAALVTWGAEVTLTTAKIVPPVGSGWDSSMHQGWRRRSWGSRERTSDRHRLPGARAGVPPAGFHHCKTLPPDRSQSVRAREENWLSEETATSKYSPVAPMAGVPTGSLLY